MTLGRRPSYRRTGDGPPGWLVALIAVAVVFGLYYLWSGVQSFLRAGGRGVVEATQVAEIVATTTAQVAQPAARATERPTATPLPDCTSFVVIVATARVRSSPSDRGNILEARYENDEVCVMGRAAPGSEWYLIDLNPRTRRIEEAFMHESVIEALNPTPTPSRTPTPLPTLTPAPSATPSPTAPAAPSRTPDPRATETPTPTIPPTLTRPVQNV